MQSSDIQQDNCRLVLLSFPGAYIEMYQDEYRNCDKVQFPERSLLLLSHPDFVEYSEKARAFYSGRTVSAEAGAVPNTCAPSDVTSWYFQMNHMIHMNESFER